MLGCKAKVLLAAAALAMRESLAASAVTATRTGPLPVASVNPACAYAWEVGWAKDEEEKLKLLRICCQKDIFTCWDVLHTFEDCCVVSGRQGRRQENVSRVHLVTYGSRHFSRRAQVLADDAMRTGWFATARVFSREDLDPDFKHAHGRFLRMRKRLGGYGIWKPQIILQMMRDMQDGEIVLYLDAGCEVNVRAAARFRDYLRATEQSPLGLFTYTTTLGAQVQWTKGDLVQKVAPWFQGRVDEVLQEPQHITGIIFVQKIASAVDFMEQWRSLMGNYRLIDDSPSRARNSSGYVEHRHDQSVFSMMLYANDHRYHIRDESLAQPDQRHLTPILASRLCGATHFLEASRADWLRAGCTEQPAFMPTWAHERAAAAAARGGAVGATAATAA